MVRMHDITQFLKEENDQWSRRERRWIERPRERGQMGLTSQRCCIALGVWLDIRSGYVGTLLSLCLPHPHPCRAQDAILCEVPSSMVNAWAVLNPPRWALALELLTSHFSLGLADQRHWLTFIFQTPGGIWGFRRERITCRQALWKSSSPIFTLPVLWSLSAENLSIITSHLFFYP